MDRLIEKYKRAFDYETILNTSGFKRLKEEKTEILNKLANEYVHNGLKTNLELQESMLEVRGILKLLDEIERESSRREKYEGKLKDMGINVN